MSVRKEHTQESEQTMKCDQNHLSLCVAVTTEPPLKCGHGLELIQSQVESQKKTFEYDDQNVTKITSPLADTCIQFYRPVTPTLEKTLCKLNSCDHFSHSVSSSFLSQCCNHVVIKLDWYLENEQVVHGMN